MVDLEESAPKMQTLLIDNYDSFTYNLYQLLTLVCGKEPIVVFNDAPWIEVAKRLTRVDAVVISPGPGSPHCPADLGVSHRVLQEFNGPVLGVCMGLQGMAVVFGGKVEHAEEPMHGRLSPIVHNNSDIFEGIPSPFRAIRYNSLVCNKDSLPECFEVTAYSEDRREVMGLRHREKPFYAVQFHPESVCTEHGKRLVENFDALSRAFWKKHASARQPSSRAGPMQNLFSECSGGSTAGANGVGEGDSHASPSGCSLELHYRRVEYVDPEQVFLQLYASESTAFWLDSAENNSKRCRFSFMGGVDGPLSLLHEYDLSSRTLKTTKHNTHVSESILEENFFSFLNKEIQSRQYSMAHPHSSTTTPTCAPEESGVASKGGGSTDELPFDFSCGFVGYVGYEMKSSCGVEPAPTAKSKIADVRLIFADRMLVFDHHAHHCYVLALAPKEVEPSQTHATSTGGEADDTSESLSSQEWVDHMAKRLTSGEFSRERSARSPLAFQRKESTTDEISRCPLSHFSAEGSTSTPKFALRHREPQYNDAIRQCLQKITDGESYELCLTTQVSSTATLDPLDLYCELRRCNAAPYASYFRFGDELAVVSCSPERFLKVDRSGWAECKPIKGTLPRGDTSERDAELKVELETSEKNFSENIMIVDLMRNDLGKVCRIGSVSVPKLTRVESYATVHQLVSTVRGQLRPERSAVDCFRSIFPPGSMTGAPKVRSMEILADLERGPRGVYSGCIGYFALNGSVDMNVVIRTAVCTPTKSSPGTDGGDEALTDSVSTHKLASNERKRSWDIDVGAGGAIVSQSDVHEEYAEMLLKAKALVGGISRVAEGYS